MSLTVRSPATKRKKPTAPPTAAAFLSTGHEGSSQTSQTSRDENAVLKDRVDDRSETGETKGRELTGRALEVGEKSGPSATDTGMDKTVDKLDENAYKPWGTNSNSNSRSNSDVGSESDVCKGGPGREVCGEAVEDGVQCDKCDCWFHTTCQKIPKPAVTALKKYSKALSWLCD